VALTTLTTMQCNVLLVFTARRYASMVNAVVMCLCVCLSATLRYCIKMAKSRITQIIRHDSPGTRVHGEIRTGSPPTGATNAGGVG